MGYDSVLRNGIATINRATASLHVAVTHEAWIADDTYSKPTFDDPVTRMAIVTMRQRSRRLPDGREIVQRATVLFVGPVEANGASGRREPVDPRDRITLPSGFTGPVLDVEGVVDPETGGPYTVKVTLGEGGGR